jgi:DNA-binding winged helix-turn-helix (wHTH) protein
MQRNAENKSRFGNKLRRQLESAGFRLYDSFGGGNLPSFFDIAEARNTIVIDLGGQVCETSDIRTIMMVSPKSAQVSEDITNAELLASIQNLFCKCENGSCTLRNAMLWNNGDLEADFESRVIKKRGTEISVTPNEFKIFSHLAQNYQRAVTRYELALQEAIGTGSDVLRQRVVDSHVKNLRKKIEDDSKKPRYIITVRNMGYRFARPDEKAAQKEI